MVALVASSVSLLALGGIAQYQLPRCVSMTLSTVNAAFTAVNQRSASDMYYIEFQDEYMAKMFAALHGGTRNGKSVTIKASPGILDYAQAYGAVRINYIEAGGNGSK